MAEAPEDFIDREAEESDEEDVVPKKKAKMGKLMLADSDADSSEEEEIEDEAQIREEMRGFVVDDREAEAEVEKQKSHGSSSSSDEDEVADDDLDEDDIDLIHENSGFRVPRHKPKKRVVMMESDDEDEERAGGSADRVKETIAQQIFENDTDERAPSTPSAAQQGAAKRAAREKERVKDALIVRGDEEEEEEEDAEEDLDDFIVDESGRPVSEKNRRRQVVHGDAALQEAQDIFGIDFDFDGDEAEKEEEYSDEEDMGEFEDEERPRGAARRGKPAYAMFDPADLERSFLTEADQKIRAKDEPERFQLRHVEVDFVKDAYGGDINEEADWIFRHYFVEPPLSRQFVYFEPGHSNHSASAVAAAADSGTAAPTGSGQADPEEIEAVPMDEYLSRKNAEHVLTSIRETLNNIRFQQLEVPFINNYRKEQCVELDSRDLWTIYRADEQYTQLKRRRLQLSRLFERMRDYLASLNLSTDGTNAPSDSELDVLAASGTRTLTERDVQRVREAGTHEQLADNYKFFALHYAHLLGPMKRFEAQRRAEKRERSKAERAAKRNRKLRDADGEPGDGDDDAEADADEDDEPDDEEERSAADGRMQKLAVRRDAVWFSRQAGLGRFVAYFGLSVEEFGENMRENYARHETRQYPVEPLEAARDFVGGRFTSEEDVVKAARVLFARQVAADPDVRHAARVAYFERAHVRMRPTRKGIAEIDERHPLTCIKYLKPMPVRELRQADLLEMVHAAKDGLVTWEFTLDELGDASRRLSSAFEEYCALFKRDEQTPLVAHWNIERRLVLDYAFNKLLFPEFAHALQTKLTTEAREGIARRYATSLARQLRVAPYAPPELRNNEDFDPARGRYARVIAIAFADRDQVPFAVCIDSDGQVGRDVRLEGLLRRPAAPHRDNDHDGPTFPLTGREASRRADQRAEERTAEQAVARLKAFIAREKPHVIAITAESVAALNIRERVERIVEELRSEREQHAARGGGDEAQRHVPVEIVDNELSVLFSASKRGASEFKDRPPVYRQAVSLARRLQDPLLEFIQLWNADEELLTLRLDPQQDSLPRDELAVRVLNEILDAVALVGCDVNRALNSPYYAPIFTFISGLGPRKAYHVLRKLKAEHRRLENRTELVTKCGLTRRVCTNAFGFIHIDTKNLTEQTDNYVEVLDSTRVHVEAYDWARKMAVDALEYDDADGDAGGNARRERDEANPAQALEEVMGAPERLRDLDLDAFAEELERQGFGNKRITLYDIRQELTRPFAELRRPRISLRNVALLYSLVKESRESLHVGSLVEANVTGFAFRRLTDEERGKPPRSIASSSDGTTPQYACPFCRRIFVDRVLPAAAGVLSEPQTSGALADYWTHLDLAARQPGAPISDEGCPGTPCGVRVRLYNGLDGFIPLKLLSSSRVEDPRERVRIGMQVRGRVIELRVNEPPPGTQGRSSFSVTLTTRSTDLRDEKHEYRQSRHDYYDDDAERMDESREQELKARAPVSSFVPRVIVHANFANAKLTDVAERLRACEPGEVVFRPSRLPDRLILTWKVDDTFDVLDHVDIREEDKPNAFSLGRRLYISKYKSGERDAEEAFEDLDEIVARYVQPMAAYARDILAHRYYVRDRALTNAPPDAPLAPLEQLLRAEKTKAPSRIPYCFSVARDTRLTGKFCLSYLPNRSVRHEYLTPTPDGVRFRNVIHSTLDRLIAWFKEHYNEPPPEVDAPGASPAGSDFSRISVRTTDSDVKARQLQRSRADHASTAQLEAAAASRQRSNANVKPFPLGAALPFGSNAASTTGSRAQQPVVIDDDEPQSQPTFRRPADAPPRRGCFNCGQDGHISRDCTRPRNSDRGGRGGGGGRGSSRACYKCNEEGHMAIDCPQASARGRGRGGNTPSAWPTRDKSAAASGGSGWGAQASSSSSGSGWNSSTSGATRSSDTGLGWGASSASAAAASSTTPKHTTPSATKMQTDDESWDDGPATQPSRSAPSAPPPAPTNDARRNDDDSWDDGAQPAPRAVQEPPAAADGDSWDDPPSATPARSSTATAANASFSSQLSQSQMPLQIDESALPTASQLPSSDDWDDPPAPASSASKTPVASWPTASKQPAAPAPADDDDWGDEPSGGKSQPSAEATERSAGNSSGTAWGSKPSGDAGDSSAASGGSTWGRRPSGDAEPSSGTGWGSSGGGGGGGGTGWGSSSSSGGWGGGGDSGSGSRGARGGGRGGGRGGCFNCGEDGHMSRECPNPRSERGRGGGSRGGGGGGRGSCFNCGEDGHMSRECPKPRSERGRGGGGGSGGGCFNCGEDGHMSRECPNPRSERGRGGGGRGGGGGGRGGCFNCGEDGHMSRDCPKPRNERGRGGRGGRGDRGSGSSGSGGWGSGGSSSGWNKSGGDASGDSETRSSGWGAAKSSSGWGGSSSPTGAGGAGDSGSSSGWGKKDANASSGKTPADNSSAPARKANEDSWDD